MAYPDPVLPHAFHTPLDALPHARSVHRNSGRTNQRRKLHKMSSHFEFSLEPFGDSGIAALTYLRDKRDRLTDNFTLESAKGKGVQR